MAPHMNNEEFFTALTALLSSTSQRSKGSVSLLQKRITTPEDATIAAGSILVRATDGRTPNPNTSSTTNNNKDTKSGKVTKNKKKAPKEKLSTVVAPADVDAFFVRYADICKAGMVGMKKRDRSAKKKGKAKAKTVKA